MSLNKYKQIYTEFLPYFVSYTTTIGYFKGMFSSYDKNNHNDIFINIIGYTSIGIITGLTYPISYPLFGCYILHGNYKTYEKYY